MTTPSLGRLERVNLRTIWNSESADFTPWLARPENMKVLEEALEMELEVESEEKPVGPFRADILCKDLSTNTWVLIENQLERTDHLHLGQLLTYAAGLQAVTIIWVAERFTDEHRAALDWLNEITDEKFCFLGLEVELWQIGNSRAAPKFNVVSKPNDWSRSFKQARSEGRLSDLQVVQRNYWAAFHQLLNTTEGSISGQRKARPENWMSYSVGKGGFSLLVSRNNQKQRIRASLYLSEKNAKGFFELLQRDKDSIEQELDMTLDWRKMRKECEIASYLENVDPDNESDWPRQHAWLAKQINDLYRVFAPRIKMLNLDDLKPRKG